jgi:hypothetical protein
MKEEITNAHINNQNVIILLSFCWKSGREFNSKTIHEKIELSEHIMKLRFNENGMPWLAMISGDSHMLTYDDGSSNLYGGFPIF